MRPSIVRIAELTAYLGVSRHSLMSHVQRGTFPEPYRVGKRLVYWLPEQLADYGFKRSDDPEQAPPRVARRRRKPAR